MSKNHCYKIQQKIKVVFKSNNLKPIWKTQINYENKQASERYA